MNIVFIFYKLDISSEIKYVSPDDLKLADIIIEIYKLETDDSFSNIFPYNLKGRIPFKQHYVKIDKKIPQGEEGLFVKSFNLEQNNIIIDNKDISSGNYLINIIGILENPKKGVSKKVLMNDKNLFISYDDLATPDKRFTEYIFDIDSVTFKKTIISYNLFLNVFDSTDSQTVKDEKVNTFINREKPKLLKEIINYCNESDEIDIRNIEYKEDGTISLFYKDKTTDGVSTSRKYTLHFF